MNFFQRAVINVKRSFLKTLIFFLIIFLFTTLITATIVARQAVFNTEELLFNHLPAVATLTLDSDAINREAEVLDHLPELATITPAIIDEIAKLPYVVNYDYRLQGTFYSESLTRVWLPELWSEHQHFHEEADFLGMASREGGWENLEHFQLHGTEVLEVMSIEQGFLKLTAGRVFSVTDLNNSSAVTIISTAFAKENNLNVGSVINLDYIQWDFEAHNFNHSSEDVLSRKPVELTVIGIFELGEIDLGWSNPRSELEEIAALHNHMIVPNDFLEDTLSATELQSLYSKPLFLIDDPRNLEAFILAANAILPDFWIGLDLSSTLENVISSLYFIQNLAQWGLLAIVIFTSAGVSLANFLFLYDRKREMGIYLSLGEYKVKIVLQILIETLAIASTSIAVSILSGNAISRYVTSRLLVNEFLNRQEASLDNVVHGIETLRLFSQGDLLLDEMLSLFDISLGFGSVLMIFLIAFVVISLTTVVTTIFFLKLNAKKLLT